MPALNWYGIKVFYGKALAIESKLSIAGVECYVPYEYHATEKNGKRIIKRKAIASLLFIHTDDSTVSHLRKEYYGEFMFYESCHNGQYVPAIIPDQEMQTFITITSMSDLNTEYLPYDPTLFHTGQKVRVTGGVLKGTTGIIKRIRHNRRLLVKIDGICIVATSYIPQSLLERID